VQTANAVTHRETTLPVANPDSDFEQLFIDHYPRLVRTLVRLVGKAGQAEELASDAFCRLYQRRVHAPDENPAGWLYRTAMNLGLDALRSNTRRVKREEKSYRAESSKQPPGNPLHELMAEERRDRVRATLCRLKPLDGQVLLMGGSGFTCREMAALLGLRTESLYMAISRAKARFEREYVSLYGRGE
jgi:RNA polymerase sigma factor (sigma-70 family)